MASISNLVVAASTSRTRRAHAGSNGAWMAYVTTDGTRDSTYKPRRLVVMHYVTVMLGVGLDESGRGIADDRFTISLGHRSTSDQNGMNKLFRQLGIPFRYDRDMRRGGSRYTWLAALDPVGAWKHSLTPRVNPGAYVQWDRLNVPASTPVWCPRCGCNSARLCVCSKGCRLHRGSR